MSAHAIGCPAFRDPAQAHDLCTCGARTRPTSTLEQRAERAEADRDRLHAALERLVGASTRDELEALEATIRLMTAPLDDRAAMIDAIHALLATLPDERS